MTGRYRLVESIGQGGMGRVWRAADEMLDRQVAVKEMRIDGLDAEDTRTRRERTLREARATARIDHPNVVRVYDVVDEGERLWIVMELVKGRSLERMTVEDGPLGPRDTALLGLGLVRALRQVHARGVLHRDIKPGNVLVESGDRTGRRIVLTDFGIAAMQDAKALTMVGMLVGSPDYMAPERVSGRPQGPPSDIWSLGATLCAALGGRSPFSRDTTLATLHAVLYEEPELPAAAGPLTDILTALLEKDPSIRPSLDEAEAALHTVAFPAPTPTLRMEGAPGAGEEDSARGAESGQADGALQSAAASASERAGTSAPAWAEGELRGPKDPRGPEAFGTPGGSGTSPARGAGGVAGARQASEGLSGPGSAEGPGAPDGPGSPDLPGPLSDVRGDAPDAVTLPGPPAGSTDTSEPPPVRWTKQELPTPADPETRVVRAVRDPRVPEPETEAAVGDPAEVEDAVPGLSGASSATRSHTAPEPSDAVPPGHESPEAGVARDPGSSSDGARSVAAPDGTGGEGSAPDAADAAVAARSELGLPDEPFAPPRLPAPSADQRASASTEAVSEERSEVRSQTPPGNSGGAALRAGATTTSTPLASAPTQDSLAAGVPTEHFPMPDAPTRDTPTHAASAPTRVGPVPPTRRRPHHPDPARPAPASESRGTVHPGSSSDEPAAGPRTDPGTPAHPRPGRDPDSDPDPALILGPHPHRIPPGELPGPARPATPRRGRRRTALVAAGSVVAASAVVVAIILATTSGSPGDDRADSSTSASASASSSAPGASTPGTPSSTVEGTARPRSLPPGAHEEAGGFAWKTPNGWRRDVKTGAEVHYTSPDGRQELAAKSSLARGDLMETWRTSEQNAHQGQDYRKIRLEETTFRDHPAVVWEYTFTLGGVPWHAQLLGFNAGDKSYQINTWYQPDIETQALETYEKVKDSFTVL
ncbi:serine/threonine protein kinase [Streptomyces sp. CC0208]|uniref:serine/threonine-protein kinase n=1 Tax=Streptomyces sp. CC0208 TaxID=2306165 RepID=UPI0023E2ACE0|nr:serine/threonine protein kinase [Streptomyces sp. CC0208]